MTETETAPKPNLPQIMPAGGQVVAVVPQTVEEIFRLGKGIVQSGLAPLALTGKTDTDASFNKAVSAVAIVIMAGAELGLPPMVSLRSFTAIGGRPALYGDGLINVVRRSGRARKLKVEYTGGTDFGLFMRAGKLREPFGAKAQDREADLKAIREEFLALPFDERAGGYCDAERADTGEAKVSIFTIAQAKRAGLWDERPTARGKIWQNGSQVWVDNAPNESSWYRYPERMLGWRAAGYCLRELFGDVLGGITDDWEAREINGMIELNPAPRAAAISSAPQPPDPPMPPDPPEGGRSPETIDASVSAGEPETAPGGEDGAPSADNLDGYLDRVDEELAVAEDDVGLIEVWERLGVDKALTGGAKAKADAIFDRHTARVHHLMAEAAGQTSFPLAD